MPRRQARSAVPARASWAAPPVEPRVEERLAARLPPAAERRAHDAGRRSAASARRRRRRAGRSRRVRARARAIRSSGPHSMLIAPTSPTRARSPRSWSCRPASFAAASSKSERCRARRRSWPAPRLRRRKRWRRAGRHRRRSTSNTPVRPTYPSPPHVVQADGNVPARRFAGRTVAAAARGTGSGERQHEHSLRTRRCATTTVNAAASE